MTSDCRISVKYLWLVCRIKLNMKAKKKQTGGRKVTKKPFSNRHFLDFCKSISTKEKTYATIESNLEMQEHKQSIRSSKASTPRHTKISWNQRMCENKLSPFSSSGSLSPHSKGRSLTPMAMKECPNKKANKNVKPTSKKVKTRKATKSPQNGKSCWKHDIFHNQLIRKHSNRKITELSEENNVSGLNSKRQTLSNLRIPDHLGNKRAAQKSKKQIVDEMKDRIREKHQFSNLTQEELKVITAVTVIQRLWRQRRMKKIIWDFISPRQVRTLDLNLSNRSQLSFTAHNQLRLKETKESEPKTKEQLESSQSLKVNPAPQIEPLATELKLHYLQPESEKSLKQEQLPTKQYYRFVECYRDILLHKDEKPNVFSVPESFSEKCLMQTLYKKIFKKSPRNLLNKDNPYEFFTSKSTEKSKELILNLKSPPKKEIVELEERFYTQAHDEEDTQVFNSFDSLRKFEEENKQETKIEPLQQPISSIGKISEMVIKQLLDTFSEQYYKFTMKKCLPKKKKCLPGLKINQTTMSEYLNGFRTHILRHHGEDILDRYQKVNTVNFLQIYHMFVYDEDDSELNYDELEFNLQTIPPSLFHQYQVIFEKNSKILADSIKYKNFLQGINMIHNLCLCNCLSESVQKLRIQRLHRPWEHDSWRISKQSKSQELGNVLDHAIELSLKAAGKGLGKLYRRDEKEEERKQLKAIREEYDQEVVEDKHYDEMLEIRLNLTRHVEQLLWEEVAQFLI